MDDNQAIQQIRDDIAHMRTMACSAAGQACLDALEYAVEDMVRANEQFGRLPGPSGGYLQGWKFREIARLLEPVRHIIMEDAA